MEIKITSGHLKNARTKAVISFIFKEQKKFPQEIEDLDKVLDGSISQLKRELKFDGSEGKIVVVPTFGKGKSDYVILVGAGSKRDFELDKVRRLGAAVSKKAKELKVDKLLVDGEALAVKDSQVDVTQALTEGLILGSYKFDKYLSKKDDFKIKDVQIRVSRRYRNESQEAVRIGKILAESQNFTRDLVNEPGNVITPQKLAEIAEELAKEYGFEVKIYDEEEIEKMGMNAYLAVAKGSANPPRFIHLTYRPKKAKKEIVLIGKGLTFDSGGLNIKPGDYMRWMKSDKSGACAVLGVFKAIGELKPDIAVHGIIAAAENMPDGKSYRPDDIIKAKNGVSIEIGNTDAEGRLTLADALSYASELKPDAIIDMATLTGACIVALGEYTAGVMGNNQRLINEVLEVSEKTGEWMWQLPFNDMLREHIKAPNADVYNIGTTRYGGAITAGLFLEKFVDKKIPWVHIDIAGPAHNTRGWYYHPKGATGFPVRTITTFLLKQVEK
ncbi:leucyl aminopeptidase [Persephonella hydrogeniphila]|uniref:Probable cytosol aminopeptidase n=1 Tax=Persephonella hydrogeniphila TaxID=198703 RepID=A0A285NES6_9AQUI|nr:leucyl aminopeptidase [Persephonella hydrogeniphila]SNZ07778.1 leucyl aminopeptidase [Persephonella hydrogeniphila]